MPNDESTAAAPPPVRQVAVVDAISRWVCEVVHSGYHNGSHCTPEDPHALWSCGWKFHVTFPAPGPRAKLTGRLEVTP